MRTKQNNVNKRESRVDLEVFGSSLDWKQFEGLAELAFKSFGYKTIRNYRIKKPRAEIDLLAIADGHAFAVDCKRWKRTVGYATMTRVATHQIARCLSLLKSGTIEHVIPVILTLHDERLLILENGVPIVPIRSISDFLLNWDSPAYGIRSFDKSEINDRSI